MTFLTRKFSAVLILGFALSACSSLPAKSVDASQPRPAINQPAVTQLATAAENSDAKAKKALSELLQGNERFKSGLVRTDGQTKADIVRLASGQSPKAVILSCSDSRVPPETVFDQKLGEIFTVRTAGETLSPQVIGSIEFAIEKLGSQLIVVMGHTNCGAVKAAVDTIEGQDAGSNNLNQLVQDIHPRLMGKFSKANPSINFRDESWLNARGVKQDLIKRSGVISRAVSSGKVQINVGIYDLATGSVEME